MIRLGVTGTDTGVGKTFVAVLLVKMLSRRKLRVGVMKPVETGVTPDDPRSDAARLLRASGNGDSLETVRPLLIGEPLAPWVAASRAGTTVDVEALDRAFERLQRDREAVVVEGAGGLLVPLTRELAFDALFARWELDVVVVAGNRLGALNHTLLTVRAAHDAGLRVRGVVLNTLSAEPPRIAERTNLEALQELLAPIPVLPLPWMKRPDDDAYVLEVAEENGLGRLFEETT
jgi:dethiobiotin synthetase